MSAANFVGGAPSSKTFRLERGDVDDTDQPRIGVGENS
jgi:hypothetical protein